MNAAPAPVFAPDERSELLDRVLVSAFLDNIPDYVYYKDLDSRFIAVSRSLIAYHGCRNTAGVIGKTDFDLFSPAHAQPAFDDEQRIIRTGEPMIGKLERETWSDGR